MKFEIEITDDEIKARLTEIALEMVGRAVRARATNWTLESDVKAQVNALWPETLARHIQDEMQNVPKMKAKIREVLERKLQAQLTKAIKESA